MAKKKVCFLAYAEYYNDARIKSYINTLIEGDFMIDLFCLYDPYSHKDTLSFKRLSIYFLGKKYQGNNRILYLLNYFIFLIKSFLYISFNFIRKNYSVFHVHNQPDLLIFSTILPKIFGRKVILDLHDIMIAGIESKFNGSRKSLLYKLTKLQTKISVAFSDVLICADHSQKEYLIENGITHKNLHVFLNLPDTSLFRQRVKYKPNFRVRLVFHGTFAQRLGLDLIIKAVEIIGNKKDITLTLIGDGDQKESLLKYCSQKDLLNKQVFFKPFIPVESLQMEIEKYDIGIIGNRKTIIAERCMLPVKLLEYLYIGLPVIAPRLYVIQKYFSDKMIEFYEPDNINDMSVKIVYLSDNLKRRTELIESSKDFFKTYNWDNQKSKYINMMNTLST